MNVRVFFDGEPVDLPGDTLACIDTETLDDGPSRGLNPAKRPVVMRPLAQFRDLRWAFVRREGKWVTVRVEGWAEEAERFRGDVVRAGIRYRVAAGVHDAFCAVANGIQGTLALATNWAEMGTLPRLRGYGSTLAAKLAPCQCNPGSAFFCRRKRPPEPGRCFDRECDCQCHRGL